MSTMARSILSFFPQRDGKYWVDYAIGNGCDYDNS
jgi:hypothetical protein